MIGPKHIGMNLCAKALYHPCDDVGESHIIILFARDLSALRFLERTHDRTYWDNPILPGVACPDNTIQHLAVEQK